MISFILLFWIGYTLSAPIWYFILVVFCFMLQIIQFGCKMYKIGSKKED